MVMAEDTRIRDNHTIPKREHVWPRIMEEILLVVIDGVDRVRCWMKCCEVENSLPPLMSHLKGLHTSFSSSFLISFFWLILISIGNEGGGYLDDIIIYLEDGRGIKAQKKRKHTAAILICQLSKIV